jgi:hypothetical protein
MTRQQLEGLCGQVVAALSRCTPSGIEQLAHYHSGTIQLMRWWRQKMVLVCDASVPALKLLLTSIAAFRDDVRFLRPSFSQPTIDWQESPL